MVTATAVLYSTHRRPAAGQNAAGGSGVNSDIELPFVISEWHGAWARQ
jgi:hypothetical protein